MSMTPSAPPQPRSKESNAPPRRLGHAAFIARDAAETVDFYTRVLGMELAHAVIDDRIPSTGDPFPYFHLFFRMADDSSVAFFVAPGLPEAASPSHPAYDIFNHFAFHAASREEIHSWKQRLEAHGVSVLGPVDHNGELLSIYFHDPNGVRLEFTYTLPGDAAEFKAKAHEDLERWCKVIDAAKKEGRDVPQALIDFIRSTHNRQVKHEK